MQAGPLRSKQRREGAHHSGLWFRETKARGQFPRPHPGQVQDPGLCHAHPTPRYAETFRGAPPPSLTSTPPCTSYISPVPNNLNFSLPWDPLPGCQITLAPCFNRVRNILLFRKLATFILTAGFLWDYFAETERGPKSCGIRPLEVQVACFPDGAEVRVVGCQAFLPGCTALADEAKHMLSINCVLKSGPTGDIFSKMASNVWCMLTVIFNF